MKDRLKLGAQQAPTLIVAVLVLVGGARQAKADEPTGTQASEDASADVAPAGTSIPTPSAAVGVASIPAAASSVAEATPVLPVAQAPYAELTGAAWFARPRLALSVGEGDRGFKLRFFGFLEVDYMTDTTRSYDDTMGTSLVARTDTYENHHGRTQFSLRSTRLGFGFESPTLGDVTPSAVIESDFAGSQASPPGSSEAVYFDSPLFRIRHAYVKLKSPYVDLLMGHTFDVFGWQSFFDPSGLRNQLFSRNPQLRVSREFNPEGAVTVELAAAAVRPVQRDSGVPDGSAGLRVSFNGWQGIRTPGNERIQAMPLTLAVSAHRTVRGVPVVVTPMLSVSGRPARGARVVVYAGDSVVGRTTTDATGAYNLYSYTFNGLSDYPKLAIWPDAYYLAFNYFGPGDGEPCAMDRTAMIAGKTAAELAFAIDVGVAEINVESEPEMELLARIAGDKAARAQIAIRVNPDVSAGGHAKIATGKADNKFGVSMAEAERLYAMATNNAHLRPIGVACHIGSQITDLAPLEAAFAKMRALVERIKRPKPVLEIALVGKYIELPDAYLSVVESLKHAGWAHEVDVKIRWIDSELLTRDSVDELLGGIGGIVVPGGFGHRGIEGKILAARYARERRLPYLGLCLGLQCAVIEFARDVLGTEDANSTEFDMFTEHPVIDFMPDQRTMQEKGGTMRLGLYPARLTPGSKAATVYGCELIYERHRHRFEVNNRYRPLLEAAGMVLSGQSPDGRLVEIIELKDHPWFVASQFHPEFRSRPDRPHPLFHGFVGSAVALSNGRQPELHGPVREIPQSGALLGATPTE